jgi:hypothetical protein
MGELKKITVHVPARLLASVQAGTGEGVTETIRMALQKLEHEQFYKGMLALRGKVKLDIDLDASREDREFDEYGNVIN